MLSRRIGLGATIPAATTFLTACDAIKRDGENDPSGRVDLGVDKTEFKWADHVSQVAFSTTAAYEIGIKAQAPGGNTSTNGIRVTGKSSF